MIVLTGTCIPGEGFGEPEIIQRYNKISGTIGTNGSTISDTRSKPGFPVNSGWNLARKRDK